MATRDYAAGSIHKGLHDYTCRLVSRPRRAAPAVRRRQHTDRAVCTALVVCTAASAQGTNPHRVGGGRLALVPVLPFGGGATVLTEDFIDVGTADRAAHLTTLRLHGGFFRCSFRRQSVAGMGGLNPLHRARPGHQVKATGVGPHGDLLEGQSA
jgi:hypothetical protein